MAAPASAWYHVANLHKVDSPALLIFRDRVEENVRKMLAIAGDPARLRPHVKTHKLAEVVRLQMALGVTQFKCATIAEAEMTAACGGSDVLLAHQPVGPKVARLVQLAQAFPATKFSAIVDDPEAMRDLAKAASSAGIRLGLVLDLDCGQHRSGVVPGPKAAELYGWMAGLEGVRPAGLHAYDGHIVDAGLAARMKACEAAYAPVKALREQLAQAGLGFPTVVAGGTPTFPMHARRGDVECSPGTCVLWDHSYATKLPDLSFQPAALVLTRVVSKPGPNRLCLDLGHKAIASENPPPRVNLLNLADAKAVLHSEEHLVLETPKAGTFKVGDPLLGIPWHICPTVALYGEAVIIKNGKPETTWRIAARDRKLTV